MWYIYIMSDTGFLLKNCSQVLTMSGEGLGIVEKGYVVVEDGRVSVVCDHPRCCVTEKLPEIDCGGCVVMPGFVDPHTHLVFGGWRADEFEARLEGRSYKEIAEAGGGILSTVRATRKASEEELYQRSLKLLKEMVSYGTTTVEIKSGYGLSCEDELKILRVAKRLGESGLVTVVPTFLGAHSVPEGTAKSDYIEEVVSKMIPMVVKEGLAKFCDVFCENFVFNAQESKEILEVGKIFGLLPTIHCDEIEPSGGAEVAGEVGAVSASHLLKPSETGLKAMAEKGVVAVLLPGTTFFLQERHKPPVARLLELRITIALGSDFNPGSCTLLSQMLTAQLGCIYYGLSIVEALRGVTINAAKALRLEQELGSLEPGKWADIVVTDVPDYRHLIYRLGHNPVRMVFRHGSLVYSGS
ncbi:MAG: imidazolonepropionase [candidate division WOR-3 bacterium]